MRKPWFFAAVYWVIKNTKGEILFQKRQNTGFADGYYQLPAWNVDNIVTTGTLESTTQALIREMKEELWIAIKPNNVSIQTITHTYGESTQNYYNFFFKVSSFQGGIENKEPEKCEHLKWIKASDFKDYKIVQFNIDSYNDIEKGIFFGEKKYDRIEDLLG